MNSLMASPTNEVNSLLAAVALPAGEQTFHMQTTTGQQPGDMLPAQRAFSGELLGLLGQGGSGRRHSCECWKLSIENPSVSTAPLSLSGCIGLCSAQLPFSSLLGTLTLWTSARCTQTGKRLGFRAASQALPVGLWV